MAGNLVALVSVDEGLQVARQLKSGCDCWDHRWHHAYSAGTLLCACHVKIKYERSHSLAEIAVFWLL